MEEIKNYITLAACLAVLLYVTKPRLKGRPYRIVLKGALSWLAIIMFFIVIFYHIKP